MHAFQNDDSYYNNYQRIVQVNHIGLNWLSWQQELISYFEILDYISFKGEVQ